MSRKNKKPTQAEPPAEPVVFDQTPVVSDAGPVIDPPERTVTALALVKTKGGWVFAKFDAPLSEASAVSEPDLKIVAADKFRTAVAAQLQGDGQ